MKFGAVRPGPGVDTKCPVAFPGPVIGRWAVDGGGVDRPGVIGGVCTLMSRLKLNPCGGGDDRVGGGCTTCSGVICRGGGCTTRVGGGCTTRVGGGCTTRVGGACRCGGCERFGGAASAAHGNARISHAACRRAGLRFTSLPRRAGRAPIRTFRERCERRPARFGVQAVGRNAEVAAPPRRDSGTRYHARRQSRACCHAGAT